MKSLYNETNFHVLTTSNNLTLLSNKNYRNCYVIMGNYPKMDYIDNFFDFYWIIVCKMDYKLIKKREGWVLCLI